MACVSRRELIRDRAAKALIRVARLWGLEAYWKNPGEDHIPIWAIPEGGTESLRLTGGETSVHQFTLWVPRQGDLCNGPSATPFPPPEGLMTGAVLFIGDTPYAVNVSYDAETVYYAPVFRLDCMRYDVTVEIDGIDTP